MDMLHRMLQQCFHCYVPWHSTVCTPRKYYSIDLITLYEALAVIFTALNYRRGDRAWVTRLITTSLQIYTPSINYA